MLAPRWSPVAATAIAVGLLAVAFLIGRTSAPAHRASAASAIVSAGGVPVGGLDSRAGALAAADNYLAVASQSLEQNPSLFSALAAQVYAPQVRSRTLAQAQRVRVADAANMANYRQGGHAIALIAARRLGSYTPQSATVTSWLGGVVWGPHLAPRQTWNLVDTTLVWQHGRWLVSASSTDVTPAPVPSIVYVDGPNNQSPAFDQRLTGMSAPFYGTGG